MKKALSIIICMLTCTSLVSCSNVTKQDVGVVSGGVIGGLLGSQFGQGNGKILAAGLGVMAGALVGGAIGKSMDETDKLKMNQTLDNNNVGQPAYWRNSRSDTNYTVVPTRNVSIDGNPYCREYRTTANIAGKQQQMYGTACRQPDGTWQMVSS